jgi:hypothetical protein
MSIDKWLLFDFKRKMFISSIFRRIFTSEGSHRSEPHEESIRTTLVVFIAQDLPDQLVGEDDAVTSVDQLQSQHSGLVIVGQFLSCKVLSAQIYTQSFEFWCTSNEW